MKRIVISQPMFFPWVGFMEQIRLADAFVHYDDVQYSKGSFTNRVQIKTPSGTKWLTVPLAALRFGQAIRSTCISERSDWRGQHLALLAQSYAQAPYRDDMLSLVKEVYLAGDETIDALSIRSMKALADYYHLDAQVTYYWSSKMGIDGKSSDRVLKIVRALAGDVYITGHGARTYLDHVAFEQQRVRVEYMDYRKVPYPQLHGVFTPFVSTLDLIANTGPDGAKYIQPRSLYWKEFIKHE